MNADKAAFLRAVIAAPDDDLPRLIFADWLDEHGEPERAEFIRVQCALETLRAASAASNHFTDNLAVNPAQACGCTIHALRRRERELLTTRRAWGWIGETLTMSVGVVGTNWDAYFRFRRGFVEEVACSWENFVRHQAAIREATPLRRVRLTVAPLGLNHWRHFFVDPATCLYGSSQFPGIEFELPPPPPQL